MSVHVQSMDRSRSPLFLGAAACIEGEVEHTGEGLTFVLQRADCDAWVAQSGGAAFALSSRARLLEEYNYCGAHTEQIMADLTAVIDLGAGTASTL